MQPVGTRMRLQARQSTSYVKWDRQAFFLRKMENKSIWRSSLVTSTAAHVLSLRRRKTCANTSAGFFWRSFEFPGKTQVRHMYSDECNNRNNRSWGGGGEVVLVVGVVVVIVASIDSGGGVTYLLLWFVIMIFYCARTWLSIQTCKIVKTFLQYNLVVFFVFLPLLFAVAIHCLFLDYYSLLATGSCRAWDNRLSPRNSRLTTSEAVSCGPTHGSNAWSKPGRFIHRWWQWCFRGEYSTTAWHQQWRRLSHLPGWTTVEAPTGHILSVRALLFCRVVN